MASKQRTDIEAKLTEEVKTLIPLQAQMLELEQKPEVLQYLEIANSYKEREKKLRLDIQKKMEENNIKSIKGSWGYMTIAEKKNLKAIDIDLVPVKFTKRVLDTTKVTAHLALTNKLPKGVSVDPSRSLTISLKPREVKENG